MRQTRTPLLAVSMVMVAWTSLPASSIRRLNLAELPGRAEVVVLGQVVKVAPKGDADEVTIRIAAFLKGSTTQMTVTMTLVPRGLKGFDPTLKVGQTGVFFLTGLNGASASKAYWGSIAVFNSPNFVIAEDKP